MRWVGFGVVRGRGGVRGAGGCVWFGLVVSFRSICESNYIDSLILTFALGQWYLFSLKGLDVGVGGVDGGVDLADRQNSRSFSSDDFTVLRFDSE